MFSKVIFVFALMLVATMAFNTPRLGRVATRATAKVSQKLHTNHHLKSLMLSCPSYFHLLLYLT